MIRPASSFLCLLALAAAPALHAQVKGNDAVAKAALLESIHRIHLYDPSISWHATASVQLLQQGQPTEQGTVDITRDIQGDLRTVFAFPDFHQTDITTPKGNFVTGDQGDAPAALTNFIRFFDMPERIEEVDQSTLRTFEIKRKTIDFHCSLAARTANDGIAHRQTFCNIIGSPTLRYFTIGPSYVTLLNNVTTFENGDVPTRAVIFFQGAPIARLTMTFTPLPGATAIQPAANAAKVPEEVSAPILDALNEKLVIPHMTSSPVRIAPIENGSILYRIELNNGKVQSVQIVAATDMDVARDVAANVRKTLTTTPPAGTGHRFVNYPYILHVDQPNADANADLPDVPTAD